MMMLAVIVGLVVLGLVLYGLVALTLGGEGRRILKTYEKKRWAVPPRNEAALFAKRHLWQVVRYDSC